MNARAVPSVSSTISPPKKNLAVRAPVTALLALSLGIFGQQAQAATDVGCEGGGFSVMLPSGALTAPRSTLVSPFLLGAGFLVQGKFVTFEVDPATLGIRNYALTGAPNPLDMTGGVPTTLFASKTPNLGAVALNGYLTVELNGTDVLLQRNGPGVSMTVQARDCAHGGIFQMEPARVDGLPTDFTHVLADGVFYFDNPNFRNPPPLPLCTPPNFTSQCYPVPVTPRINFANDLSPKFVGRDSPQVATRISQSGGVSVWRVASGGRMLGVLGEDSVGVAPPPMNCGLNCLAQSPVSGTFPVLGFPFPVPEASRLTPRTP